MLEDDGGTRAFIDIGHSPTVDDGKFLGGKGLGRNGHGGTHGERSLSCSHSFSAPEPRASSHDVASALLHAGPPRTLPHGVKPLGRCGVCAKGVASLASVRIMAAMPASPGEANCLR